MYESPSQRSQLDQGNEWEYLHELDAMSQWLCRGDEASEALARATKAIDTFRGPEMVKRWIHEVTSTEVENSSGRSLYMDFLDRFVEGKRPKHPVGSDFRDEIDFRLEVLERLCGLPDNYRCALLLKQGHGLSVDRTANVMGVSQASIRSILYRARQTLRDI